MAHISASLAEIKSDIQDNVFNLSLQRADSNTLKLLSKLGSKTPELKFIQADKNLGLVCMNTIDYHQLVLQHLNNKAIYRNLNAVHVNRTKSLCILINKKIKNLLIKLTPTLTPQEFRYLTEPREFTLPNFHCTAKLHKSPLKGRPIVGSLNWVTTPWSVYLDVILQTELQKYPSILKNTKSLTEKLKDIKLSPNCILVSLDVESLYTNINIERLCKVLAEINPLLAEIANFICSNNYFNYANELYHQINGIAMGTNVAVALANIYLARLLDIHISQHSTVSFYQRYIDDIFLIFNGWPNQLKALLITWNKLIPGINLTSVTSTLQVDFLDLTIYKDANLSKLQFKTYQKDINKYLYIPPHSYHPQPTIKGFITGEIKRYEGTNSEKEQFHLMINRFKIRLTLRGYNPHFINRVVRKQLNSINKTQLNKKPIVPLIIPYTQSARDTLLKGIMKNHKSSFTTLDSYNIMHVYSKRNNIAQYLIKSKLNEDQISYIKNSSNRADKRKAQSPLGNVSKRQVFRI